MLYFDFCKKVQNRPRSCELYGYDFMVDDQNNPQLIEVNSSPAMDYSTDVTKRLVKQVLPDCMKVLLEREKWDRERLIKRPGKKKKKKRKKRKKRKKKNDVFSSEIFNFKKTKNSHWYIYVQTTNAFFNFFSF